MQSIGEKALGFDRSEGGGLRLKSKGAAKPSWFSVAEAYADQAARAGFVLSMMFLTAAAIYSLALSGAVAPVVAEMAASADRMALEAGLRLEDLSISGTQNTPRTALTSALQLPYAGSSLFYDTAVARARLLNIGWVESAEVRRVFPSRLEVVLVERTPFARWVDQDNKVQAIDRDGRLLGTAEDGRFAGLPLLSGQGAPSEAAAFCDPLADRDPVARRIERAELIAGRFWMVALDNGMSVKLPRKVNGSVLDRLESLLANSRIADIGVGTIDLRLSHRTILQLRDPTATNRDRAIASLTQGQALAAPASKKGRPL